MAPDRERPPMFATCLAAHRDERGYSLAEVAVRLHALSRETEGFDAGPTPKTVWRWEQGVKPCNRHRRLLCRLYGVSAAELGFRASSDSVDVSSAPAVAMHELHRLDRLLGTVSEPAARDFHDALACAV